MKITFKPAYLAPPERKIVAYSNPKTPGCRYIPTKTGYIFINSNRGVIEERSLHKNFGWLGYTPIYEGYLEITIKL